MASVEARSLLYDRIAKHRARRSGRLIPWAPLRIQVEMAKAANSSWLARRLQGAIEAGLSSAYHHVKVDPAKYLAHLRRAYGLPVQSFGEMHKLPLPVIDYLSEDTIRAAMKFGLAEGAGLGLGGVFSILPDIGALSAITIRMVQKLSLIHGFEYSTDEEVADLWIATASAAGVDLGKELVEKHLLERFVPRVIERVAVKAGSELTEKLAARMVPLLSAALGGTLNYYFVRSWGNRAQRHFRERCLFSRRYLGVGQDDADATPQSGIRQLQPLREEPTQ